MAYVLMIRSYDDETFSMFGPFRKREKPDWIASRFNNAVEANDDLNGSGIYAYVAQLSPTTNADAQARGILREALE